MKALAVLPLMLGVLVTPAAAQNAQPQKPVTFNGMVFDAPPPQGYGGAPGWYQQGYPQAAYAPRGYGQPGYAPGYPRTAYAPGYPQRYAPGYPQMAYAPGGYGQQGYAPPRTYRQHAATPKTYHHARRHVRYKSSAS